MIRPTYLLHYVPEWNKIIESIVENKENSYADSSESYYVTTSITSFHKTYYTVMYNKLKLGDDQHTNLGLLRSVVLNDQNRVVAFSPPKAWNWNDFVLQHPHTTDGSLIAEELIEGTEVTLFWDASLGLQGSWEIATRRRVGGDERGSQKNIREMFLEAAGSSLPFLNTHYCYHFVLQHPDYPRVYPVQDPRLYLVDAYEISYPDPVQQSTHFFISPLYKCERERIVSSYADAHKNIHIPTTYSWSCYTELWNQTVSMNTPFFHMGVVVRNELSGMRTKRRNPQYEFRKCLYESPTTSIPALYHYICLRQTAPTGAIQSFLATEHGNIYRTLFSFFRRYILAFVMTLYDNYIKIYVTKTMCYTDVPITMHRSLTQLHYIYTQRLLEKKCPMQKKKAHITRQDVRYFVRTMNVSDLLNCLVAKGNEDVLRSNA